MLQQLHPSFPIFWRSHRSFISDLYQGFHRDLLQGSIHAQSAQQHIEDARNGHRGKASQAQAFQMCVCDQQVEQSQSELFERFKIGHLLFQVQVEVFQGRVVPQRS